MASSWNPQLVEHVQSMAAREARYVGVQWAFATLRHAKSLWKTMTNTMNPISNQKENYDRRTPRTPSTGDGYLFL
jgi:hypothetical protein